MTIGMVEVAPLGCEGSKRSASHYDIDIDAHQLCCDCGQPFDPILRIAELDGDIFSFNPPQLS